MINQRIASLRNLMKKKNIDLYIIPTSDFHGSENEGVYFKSREYMSGFTGSAGTLIVTKKEAVLFTDGRYFIQAAKELEGSEIILYKDGEKGVPTINQYIYSRIRRYECVGFDGRVMNAKTGKGFEKVMLPNNVKIKYQQDLVGVIWKDRPALLSEPMFVLEGKYAGMSVEDKLIKLRQEMKSKNADLHLLTSLDDIGWLYNFRGNDIPYNPVTYAYSVITFDKAYIFVNMQNMQSGMREYFNEKKVGIFEYGYIGEFLKKTARKSKKILLDLNKINYSLYKCIPNGVNLEDALNPTTYFKAVKNNVEIENIKNAHIKDGVCVTKFIYWLKNNVGKEEITEVSAADYLYNLRKSMDGFIEESFRTISAYNENAAMMHYSPYDNPEVKLKNQGLLLVDSGGHYKEGTTDVTRTIILGEISQDIKIHYTTVVKSMLRLARAKFLYGCTGLNLDVVARGPIWDLGLDYKCGTGHGVGYALNVHEGPNSFRWKNNTGRDTFPIETGMITTDEPGIYIEGSHGIRIENELLCVENEENDFGKFMSFETITYVPIDLDGIDYSILDESDLKALRSYNDMVLKKISEHLTKEEKDFFYDKPVYVRRHVRMKKLLFIFNPHSGKTQIKTKLVNIIDVFEKAGYRVSIHSTQGKHDAMNYVKANGSFYDLVVCSGGDGTLNEVMTGLMGLERRPNLGYIPAGSTNDFSVGMKLSKNMIKAAKVAVKGKPFPVDMGTFNEKMFIYVAAFGAFSDVSYRTPQGNKNMLGHTAYVLEALKSVRTIKPHHLIFKCDDQIIEGEFIYGMITNAVSVGGIKGITGNKISLNDGLFEVMLIKKPRNAADVQAIASALMGIETDSDCVSELKASKIYVKNIDKIPWSLDGEYGGSPEKIAIRNHKRVINIMSSFGVRLFK